MNVFSVLTASIYAVVFITLIMNLFQLYKESGKLAAEGKTPLVGRNVTVIILAALGEFLVGYGVIYLSQALNVPMKTPTVIITFGLAFVLRNVGAYLVAWALWAIFVRYDSRKMKKELENERAAALK